MCPKLCSQICPLPSFRTCHISYLLSVPPLLLFLYLMKTFCCQRWQWSLTPLYCFFSLYFLFFWCPLFNPSSTSALTSSLLDSVLPCATAIKTGSSLPDSSHFSWEWPLWKIQRYLFIAKGFAFFPELFSVYFFLSQTGNSLGQWLSLLRFLQSLWQWHLNNKVAGKWDIINFILF